MVKKRKKKKRKALQKRVYEGAQYSRLTSDWVTSSTSADSEIYTALRPLRNRSRELCRNNDYVKGAVSTIVDNVIGKGIGFQSQVKKRRKDALDQEVNRQIEEAWKDWCESGCDVTERLAFPDMEWLIMRSLIESGEVLVRKIYQPFGDSEIPFSLEIIEADQLWEDHSAPHNPTKNNIRMGVELDEWNRAIAYHLYPFHPGDYQFQTNYKQSYLIRVPASEIFHLYLVERPGQTRGVPWLASSLIRTKHLAGFEEAELVKARGQASLMGFRQTPDPDYGGETDAETGQEIMDFSPGEIFKLAPGEVFQGFAPTSPNQAFNPFVQMMLRGISTGLSMSYESLSHDYSNTSYSSARQSILEERDSYKRLQAWLIRSFLKPLFKEWLEMAVLSNVVNLNGFELMPRHYCKPKFIPRRWDWVDPSKDIKANIDAIDNNISSLTQVISEQGRDIEEVMVEKAREKALMEQLGLVDQPADPEPVVKTVSQWKAYEQRQFIMKVN